jgi:signal peptidase II
LKYVIFVLVALTIIVADQLTKSILASSIPLNDAIKIIPGYLDLVHVRNPGAAFGMLAQSDSWFRLAFFPLISILATTVILWLLFQANSKDWSLVLALALFCGGLFGNFIDRMRFGEVVDFVDVHVGTIHWPAFNVADSALCVGTGLFLLYFLRKKPTENNRNRIDNTDQ